jgi:hypothetical protein
MATLSAKKNKHTHKPDECTEDVYFLQRNSTGLIWYQFHLYLKDEMKSMLIKSIENALLT